MGVKANIFKKEKTKKKEREKERKKERKKGISFEKLIGLMKNFTSDVYYV